MSDDPSPPPNGVDGPRDEAEDPAAEASVARAIRLQRLAKVEALRAGGVVPYPPRFDRDRTLGELRQDFGHLEPGAETDTQVRVAGRLMLKRDQGKLVFATLRDRNGDVSCSCPSP